MKKLLTAIVFTALIATIAMAAPVDNYLKITSGASTAQGTCSSALRGLIFNVEGGGAGGVVDALQMCRKLASGSYGWASVTTAP